MAKCRATGMIGRWFSATGRKMRRTVLLCLSITMVASACASTAKKQPAEYSVDTAELRNALQRHYDQFETCVMFPRELSVRGRHPNRVTDHVQLAPNRKGVDKQASVQPLIEAGLVEIAKHPDERRGRYEIFLKFTEQGISSFSKACLNDGEFHGRPPHSIGFRAFDIEVDEINTYSKNDDCLPFAAANYYARAVNLASWYDHEKLGNLLNRSWINPSVKNGNFESRAPFYRFNGVWNYGFFDYAHSNLVCLDKK